MSDKSDRASDALAVVGKRVPPALVMEHREQTITRLSEAFAHDMIDVDEYERRTELAEKLDSLEGLSALTADLSEVKPSALQRVVPSTARNISTWFGSQHQSGSWTMPARLSVSARFGNVEIDLRTATLESRESEIDLSCYFGAVTIIVPPHMAVDLQARATFGATTSVGEGDTAPTSRVVLRGRIYFSSLEIHVRIHSESEKDLRKRLKLGKRQLAAGPPADE